MNSVLCLAAGEGRRFGPGKSQITIRGETLIHRMANQVSIRGDELTVVSHSGTVPEGPYNLVEMAPRMTSLGVCQTLFSSRSHWRDRTIVLLGDVIYDPIDFNTIYNFDKDVMFFGTEYEIYGISFSGRSRHVILNGLHMSLRRALKDGHDAKLWRLWHNISGLDDRGHEVEKIRVSSIYTFTKGYTRDFDTPDQVEKFKESFEGRG